MFVISIIYVKKSTFKRLIKCKNVLFPYNNFKIKLFNYINFLNYKNCNFMMLISKIMLISLTHLITNNLGAYIYFVTIDT